MHDMQEPQTSLNLATMGEAPRAGEAIHTGQHPATMQCPDDAAVCQHPATLQRQPSQHQPACHSQPAGAEPCGPIVLSLLLKEGSSATASSAPGPINAPSSLWSVVFGTR